LSKNRIHEKRTYHHHHCYRHCSPTIALYRLPLPSSPIARHSTFRRRHLFEAMQSKIWFSKF
jgi:hypothetical protein